MTNLKALLQGFVDTHIHAGPTLTVREFNIWQLAAEAEKGGFRAMVLKDHFIPTVPVARAIQEKLGHPGIEIFGSLALNNDDVADLIKALDVAKIVLSSDLGLKNAGWPIEGMSAFLELLHQAGVGAADLKKMITSNPANLLNLKASRLEGGSI